MRLFFSLVIFFLTHTILSPQLFAQKKPKDMYETQWKEIDELISKKGLYKSALEKVDELYKLAKKEKQTGQQIKALRYRIQLNETLVDENEMPSITLFKKEIEGETGVARALMQVLLADYYKSQYRKQRWNLYQRTSTTDADPVDITTWSAVNFHQTISELYRAAINEPALKEEGKLSVYEPLVIKGNTSYRASLYELVLQKALSYFEEEPVELPRAADQSYWANPRLWAPVDEFMKSSLPDGDSTDPGITALHLMQNLLKYYRDKNQAEQLAQTDLDRIKFLKAKSEVDNKEETYFNALKELEQKHRGTDVADLVIVLMASWYRDVKDDLAQAVEIASALANSKKKSQGAIEAYNMVEEIRQPALNIAIERVNLPDQPFRTSVEWKNINRIHFRIIKLDSSHKDMVERGDFFNQALWANILAEPIVRQWEQPLPASSDFKMHRAEVKVDALPIGTYLIITSDNPSFNLKESNMALAKVQVSNISFIGSGQDYFVLHRNTGQPLAKAKVIQFGNKYNYTTRRYNRTKLDELTTNSQGYFFVRKTDEKYGSTYVFDITHGKDRLLIDEGEYIYRYSVNDYDEDDSPEDIEEDNARVYFFTDRSIYRPGQIVYFKGLLTSKTKDKQPVLLTGRKATISLYNANSEKVDSLVLTSNEYGSFAGSFTLPASGLTGQFYLEDEEYNSTQYFRVEEYKRPRFEVTLEKPTTTIRLGDTVTVTGKAIAYAGNAISNASGTYRVRRNARFLYPWKMSYGRFLPQTKAAEIAHGTITTDAAGNFTISFPAIPDKSIDRNNDPVFDYSISIDITDLNGETRSASATVPVSYKSLVLSIDAGAEKMNSADFTKIKLNSTNLVGVHQSVDVNLQIAPLKGPGRLLRPRYWEAPDMFVMSEKEFQAAFPNDIYKNEDDPNTWTADKAAWEKTIRTDSGGLVELGKKKWTAGWYQIIATAIDSFGDTVQQKALVYLNDPAGKNFTDIGYLSATSTGSTLKIGQQATIELLSGARDLFVIGQRINWKTQTGKNDTPFSEKFRLFKLDKNRVQIPVIATDADKGGIEVQHVFVRHNRVFTVSHYFAVPLEEKDLKIKLDTYRDKLEPGLNEKWTVSISGAEAERFGIELLTSMYDASLDQFSPHNWRTPALWPTLQRLTNWAGRTNFTTAASLKHIIERPVKFIQWITLDKLMGFDRTVMYYSAQQNIRLSDNISEALSGSVPGVSVKRKEVAAAAPQTEMEKAEMMEFKREETPEDEFPQIAPAIRTNFNETAFFFPQLTADSNGHFSFSFTMPESVTSWKWQLLAHTKSLAMGYLQQSIVTQKDLMVQPNMPRFLREGDKMEITTKVVNLTDQEFTGQAELQLIDATTNQPVDGWFRNFFPNQYFTVGAKSSELVRFPIEVPYQFDRALTWRIIARVGDKTDGESATLPVLSNRQLVTEAIPFFVNGVASKNIKLDKLIGSTDSETLSHQSMTVEFSANPAWYAIQALPYLTDYPYECSEQTFNRLYGYLVANHLLKSSPRIKNVLQQWSDKDTSALLSNLQKNQELKQVLLEETPWVLEAKSESEQKKRLLLLFDAVRLEQERDKMAAKLIELQTPNGGFSWFKGGPDDRFITQYILTGIGHLQKLGIIGEDYGLLAPIVPGALNYADQRMLEDYNKRDKNPKNPTPLNYSAVQYHYMRSFFTNKGLSGQYLEAANHYRKDIQTKWIQGNLMAKAMIALALYRTGDKQTATAILKSLQQTAIKSEDKGMYWKANTAGFYWREAPIETQALLIELFQEMKQPATTINAMKAWLLLNKQTNRWSSTKSTADACYALLLQGDNWLDAEPRVRVSLGDITIVTATQAEAGTGYYQKIIPGTAVHPEMGNVKIEVDQPLKTSAPVWGAIYWQYFDNLENITAAKGPLSINKRVMIERLTDKGPVLEPVQEGSIIKVGDKITVRLEIKTDRDMEYVHVKDMRASSLEPVNVLSGYRWKGSLGYYESTRDASTNFFISHLPKGTHVMEYSLFASHAGTFSNGISSIQCMYAPEFTSHTEGIKLMIEENQ